MARKHWQSCCQTWKPPRCPHRVSPASDRGRLRRRPRTLWPCTPDRHQRFADLAQAEALVLPVFLAGADPWRVAVGSRFGEADRVRRDRRERPRRGGRERDNGPPRKRAP
jgi:hypothetical protein